MQDDERDEPLTGVAPADEGVDEDAYEADDPKHPSYHGRMSDWADDERKRRRLGE